jgi:hypothetical protein
MPVNQPRQITRRGTNRSTNLTPRVRSLLYAAVKADIPYKRACEMIGVPFRSFRYWMEEGKTAPYRSPYSCFRRYIRRIEARKEAELLGIIDKVAKGDYKVRETEIAFTPKGRLFKRKTKIMRPEWKAAAWRLERKYRDEYGQTDPGILKTKTPDEIASDIYNATLALESSVPTEEECF